MKQLETLSIVAPGFFGLNTQESGVTLSPNFAQLADNVVIDKYGRLGARKGWTMQTTSGASELNGNAIQYMLEHTNAGDTLTILSAGNNKIFKNGIGSTLTNITPAGYTITNNDWDGACLYAHSILVQPGQEPIIYTQAGGAEKITTHTGKTQNFGTNYLDGVIAAWGRFWGFTKDAVYWSTDIADQYFPTFSEGTSGVLNIAAVLPDSTDDIKAIAAFNNFLIIFCQHNIVIYKGAENPIGFNFQLHDVIVGVGCIAHKSVQHTGNDIIFLSDTGLRSLGRLIQEKSLPMRDLTKNIRDDFLKDVTAVLAVTGGDLSRVNSVYSERDAFYLISFPTTKTVYCLDMRAPLEDGAARVTGWYNYFAYSFLRTKDRNIYIGKLNGIGKYSGYSDNGETYRLRYFSHYIDFNAPTTTKILKQIGLTILGGANQQFTIKVGTDYTASHTSYAFTIPAGSVSEYGLSEYNLASYTAGVLLDRIKSSVGGSGTSVQIGFEADVNGSELSVQKIDAFIKTGRMI